MNPSRAPDPFHGPVRAPSRADARRNHERVVAAAVEVFRGHGTQASVPQIEARAQVGKVTVYRSFPAKEDLLETITELSLERLEQRTAAAVCEADPYEDFRRYVLELFDTLAHDRLLAERRPVTWRRYAEMVLAALRNCTCVEDPRPTRR
ncbi:helix-turn-helix domain-containing protein [Streptomyces sp. NPDC007851]|uniref:TetR/AcrR family transcriptional regulator n=1 Tax=Streptomyces sp. NPDC007851 TaxID=3155008 RepID=UPI003401733A